MNNCKRFQLKQTQATERN